MDVLCGKENWDVWLYEKGGTIHAAMPYYKEWRNGALYITKALLTQNNGIIICYPPSQKPEARYRHEEHVINAACDFIESMGLGVYEQQYHYSFINCLPFMWRGYTAIPRYTCVIEDTGDLEKIWANYTADIRRSLRKAEKHTSVSTDIHPAEFYAEHEKIYMRQGLNCPFSEEQWLNLHQKCTENHAGQMLCAKDGDHRIASLAFVVWDEKSMYLLLGGNMPEYKSFDSYTQLIHTAIGMASARNLRFDFEGSVIKRIFKSYRDYGPQMKLYFRIRKVFDASLMRNEAEQQIKT